MACGDDGNGSCKQQPRLEKEGKRGERDRLGEREAGCVFFVFWVFQCVLAKNIQSKCWFRFSSQIFFLFSKMHFCK